MDPRFLLDTHVLIRWLLAANKLTRTQLRVLNMAARRAEPVAISAISLLEIATLSSGNRPALKISVAEFFRDLSGNPLFRVLPLTYEVALDAALLGVLRDPSDRAIAATARVHRLPLVTSDERIIDSKVVPVIE